MERAGKAAKHLTMLALAMQGMYFLNILGVVLLRNLLFEIFGYGVHLELPFDWVHLGKALLDTGAFAGLAFWLLYTLAKNMRASNGMGVVMGLYAYGSYFLMEAVSGRIYAYGMAALSGTAEVSMGAQIAAASFSASLCSGAKIWEFTAIVLLLIAYSLCRVCGGGEKS